MKIENDIFLNGLNFEKGIQKNIADLKSGDNFTAEILDIKPDLVVLKLNEGMILNAKSLVVPNLRIGQEASFTVKENSKGQIFVEVAKDGSLSPNFNIAKEFLMQAEIPVTEKNIRLVDFLLEKNMPLDRETLDRASFFRYALEENASEKMLDCKNTLDKVLFLLKENLPANMATVEALDKILGNKAFFENSLNKLAENISQIGEMGLKNELLKLFGINEAEGNTDTEIYAKLKKKLFLNIDDGELIENLPDKLKNIYTSVSEGLKILSKMDGAESLKNNLNEIKNNIEFMNELGSYKEMLQIPLNISGKDEQCDLYIFKNKKGEKRAAENASIVLSLNYAFLGQIDTYIEKYGKNLFFQFRIESDNTTKLIKENILKLFDLLSEKDYNVSSVAYKKLEEAFNVLKDKGFLNDSEKNAGSVSANKKRYSFDMRV